MKSTFVTTKFFIEILRFKILMKNRLYFSCVRISVSLSQVRQNRVHFEAATFLRTTNFTHKTQKKNVLVRFRYWEPP